MFETAQICILLLQFHTLHSLTSYYTPVVCSLSTLMGLLSFDQVVLTFIVITGRKMEIPELLDWT